MTPETLRRHPDKDRDLRSSKSPGRWLLFGLCVLIAAVSCFVFGQTLKYGFVNFDDGSYILNRPEINRGLTLTGVGWALTHKHSNNWHPLTSISHMLDCQLFGLNAGGHHFTNLLLHTLASILLFLVLREMTGALWRCAFVAILFAIHPLHVESVAWISERKDVLSAVFFMLTLGAYARYVGRPSLSRYVMLSILFVLGLMSKPMLVTMPLVLLLLDYWPLQRNTSPARLFLEKIPLFAVSAVSCAVTFLAQSKALGSNDLIALPFRVGNALMSYVIYIRQMIWPTKLAVFYPYFSGSLPLVAVLAAGASLLAFTVAAVALRARAPYFFVGWFWYIVILIPVIGLVQVGSQAHADRYTYLPQIGLYLIVSWGIGGLVARWQRARFPIFAAAMAMIIVLSVCAWRQTSFWRDSESIWTRALAVTSENAIAHNNLGLVFQQRGQLDKAIAEYQQAIAIGSGPARRASGVDLAYNNYGFALLQKGDLDGATVEFERAVAISPTYGDARFNLGNAFFEKGRIDDAIAQWEKALSLEPDDAEARTNMANGLLRKGRPQEAIAQYNKALEIAPESVWALNDLAWIRATSTEMALRDGAKAVELAKKADRLSEGKNPIVLRTLAAAYAEVGDFTNAMNTANDAQEIALSARDSSLARNLATDVDLYRISTPLRKAPSDE